ncbi:DAK2 domain-containing protein [Actinomadura viridis]|uniref:DAK2 domain fusion protein YloV n=1 Tax=Actinomadura viridis TaxID=58110 RepID=A0A931GHV9_9ACTN|nr:DAK2 domain-containing protein [Actinomadura viridis]MBG6087740.1 DAK2 domain fusion protein YloV [Actinomadura viridis]
MGEILDGAAVRRWSRIAAEALGRTRAEIDALNVFPVPDGDTGTNLHLTVLAAADAVAGLPGDAGTAEAWRALVQGALVGARGNSGVILSQILRGLAEIVGRPETCADREAFAEALGYAAVLAGNAVEHPVEGTILSVLDAAADAAAAAVEAGQEPPADPAATRAGPAGVARAAASGARRALRRTTAQLEVLERNGVVDAGAAGLCVVLDALVAVLSDEYPERYEVPARAAGRAVGRAPARDERDDPPGPGYEVMYLLDAEDESVPGLRESLDGLGDSLVVVGGGGLWNVHVHTDDAGAAIEAGLSAGRPHRVRVTCLHAGGGGRPQAPCAGRAVVAVTAAEGLAALFESGGARVVRREPGAVPPLAVLAEAILAAGDEVAVLPNEPEVLALAEAAAERAREGGARIAVVPSRASVQGLAALAVHDPLRRFDEDVIAMARAAGATRSGRLEVAAEEAVTSAGLCRPGDVLGLIDGDVAMIGAGVAEVARKMLDRMLPGGGELVTLIPGTYAPDGLAEELETHLREACPDVEVVVYDGGQVRFPLLIGVE